MPKLRQLVYEFALLVKSPFVRLALWAVCLFFVEPCMIYNLAGYSAFGKSITSAMIIILWWIFLITHQTAHPCESALVRRSGVPLLCKLNRAWFTCEKASIPVDTYISWHVENIDIISTHVILNMLLLIDWLNVLHIAITRPANGSASIPHIYVRFGLTAYLLLCCHILAQIKWRRVLLNSELSAFEPKSSSNSLQSFVAH